MLCFVPVSKWQFCESVFHYNGYTDCRDWINYAEVFVG